MKSKVCGNKFFIDWDEIRRNVAPEKDSEEENPQDHSPVTLQGAFLEYRKKRQEAMVRAGKLARKNRKKMRTVRRCRLLRMKFIEQCMKYIGVPYKRKYHQPGTPEYQSKLFLDCCGLVRRAMRDLKNDFGFEIGSWNQAYMFDTLPGIVPNASQMKAGDLVFITGRYFNEKSRRQLHDVVHVEVWLGDGLKTIGARWHRGKVQVFDDYRFESTSYHSMRYHFKSIDPWLQGKCERWYRPLSLMSNTKQHELVFSGCRLHAWKKLSDLKVPKRSVFSLQDQQASSSNQQQGTSVQENLGESISEDAEVDHLAVSLTTVCQIEKSNRCSILPSSDEIRE